MDGINPAAVDPLRLLPKSSPLQPHPPKDFLSERKNPRATPTTDMKFGILPSERRGAASLEEIGRRVTDKGETGPIVMTTAKVLTAIIVLITAVVTIQSWLLSNIIDGKFDRFELRMNERFASRAEMLPRAEYELRHKDLQDDIARMGDRIKAAESRLEIQAQRLEDIQTRKGGK